MHVPMRRNPLLQLLLIRALYLFKFPTSNRLLAMLFVEFRVDCHGKIVNTAWNFFLIHAASEFVEIICKTFMFLFVFFVSNPLENFIVIICFNFSCAAYLCIKLQVLATGLIVSDYDDHKMSALKQRIVYIFLWV